MFFELDIYHQLFLILKCNGNIEPNIINISLFIITCLFKCVLVPDHFHLAIKKLDWNGPSLANWNTALCYLTLADPYSLRE